MVPRPLKTSLCHCPYGENRVHLESTEDACDTGVGGDPWGPEDPVENKES